MNTGIPYKSLPKQSRRSNRLGRVLVRGLATGVCCIVLWNAASARAQDTPPAIQRAPSGTVDLSARDTRLVDILQQLAETADRNIVIAPAVDDLRVTVSLKGLSVTEILEAILPSAGCGYRDRGRYILIDTVANLTANEPVTTALAVRVVNLKYIRAVDMLAMITPFIGETGRIVGSPEAETGLGSDETGGDSSAGGDLLIIEDAPDRLPVLVGIIERIDVAPRQVLVEATILRAALDDDHQLGVDFNFLAGVDFERVGGSTVGGTNLLTGIVPPSEFDDGLAALATGFTTAIGTDGFTFGLIKNNIAVFIRALEELTDTTVLANPKVLTLNKQRGEVIIGRRDGFITTTVTQTAAIQKVEFLETGTQLTFRPFVIDGQRVRMEVHVEDSAGGLTPSDLPFETTTESTSNIIVENGQTIVIGGLFRERTDINRAQVPGLGEVPGLGALFRRSRDQTRREEIIVLLTVHVIDRQSSQGQLGEEMLDRTEQMRSGSRKRMQLLGRSRLADTHIASAIELLNAGQFDQALFHTRLALASDPLQPTGQRLYRQLVRQRDTIEPNNEMRNWVARQLNKRPAIDTITGQPIETLTDAPGATPEP